MLTEVAQHHDTTLRDRRERLGLTQEKLAETAGVSRSTIIRAEKGEYVGARLLKRLGTAVDHLEERAGERAIQDVVAVATGEEPSPLVMELVAKVKNSPPDEAARLVDTFIKGVLLMVEARNREKSD